MRKRLLPALLALVLALSLMPVAFASSTITLVQGTTGDPNKEFVYYIIADYTSINLGQEKNVEKLSAVRYNICNCGFTIFVFQENANEIWEKHSVDCLKNYMFGTSDVYKITLKSGEKISLNTRATALSIYAVQENGYSLSHSTDGINFTDYVNDGSIYLSEATVARIKFTVADVANGTFTIRRSDGSSSDYTPPTGSGTSFPDVSPNADYATAVEYVNKLGIMVGDEKGNFNPDKIVSRAEMATIVCRMLGQADNLPKSNVFTDVPTAHWGNACIGKAAELNIVGGYGNGRFGPDDPVKYEQAITMIVRAIGEEDLAISYGGYPNGHWLVAYQKNLLKEVTYLWGQGMPRSAVAVLVYNCYTAQS